MDNFCCTDHTRGQDILHIFLSKQTVELLLIETCGRICFTNSSNLWVKSHSVQQMEADELLTWLCLPGDTAGNGILQSEAHPPARSLPWSFFSLDVAEFARPLCREFTTIACREPLLEPGCSTAMVVLLTIRGNCSHVEAKSAHIVGHLPFLQRTVRTGKLTNHTSCD